MPPGHRPSPTPIPGTLQPFTPPRRRPDRTGGAAGGTLRPGSAAPNPARRPSPPAWTARRLEEGAAPALPCMARVGPGADQPHRPTLAWPGAARGGHVSVTHNQRGLQRGPAPEQPASDIPAPGGFAGGTGRRKLRTKRFSAEGGRAPLPNPRGRVLTLALAGLPPPSECALPQEVEWNGGVGSGLLGRGLGHQVFPKLGPKARRPQQRAPTEPYSWLFPTPPELPGSPGSRHSC